MGIGSNRRGFLGAVVPGGVFACSFGVMGWLAGHVVTYHLLESLGVNTGEVEAWHGYLEQLGHTTLATMLASYIVLLVVMCRRWDGLGVNGRRSSVGDRSWRVAAAAAPTAGFIVAEFVERSASGAVPPLAVLLVGILIQVALGLLVFAAVRLALAVARCIAAGRSVRMAHRSAPGARCIACWRSPRRGVLAVNLAGRAPPVATA